MRKTSLHLRVKRESSVMFQFVRRRGTRKRQVGQTSSEPCGCKEGLKPPIDLRQVLRVIVTEWDIKMKDIKARHGRASGRS